MPSNEIAKMQVNCDWTTHWTSYRIAYL